MDLMIYCSERSAFATELLGRLPEAIPGRRIWIYGTARDLEHGLRNASSKPMAVILLLSRGQDLAAMLPYSEALRSVPVILILPDAHEQTVAEGLLFRPRFLTWSNARSATSLISAVKKLQRAYEQ